MKMKFFAAIIFTLLLLASCGNYTEDPISQPSSDEPEFAMDETVESVVEETEEPEAPVSEPMPEHPTYISQDFLDLLSDYLQEETTLETLQGIVVDEVVTDEEMETYAGDPEVASHIESVETAYRGGLFLKVDGDNDGIEDIFAWVFDGGTLGNSSRHFLKGQGDGSFECTMITEGLTQELAFVNYDGTVYLLETDFDYDRKAVNGFIVSFYQDGEVLETLSLKRAIKEYEPEIIYQAEGYAATAEKYAEVGRNEFLGDDGIITKTGSAETEEDREEAREILALTQNRTYSIYRSDFDNDGEREWYWKSIFYPSNAYTYMVLQEAVFQEGKGEEGGASLLETYSLEYEGIPLYFWVDSIGDKQILLLLCYEGMDKEFLYGYLIEGERTEKVLEIDYTGISEIHYIIYTEGINGIEDA